MERALPKAGETWLHFKNKRYEIIACPVIHSETREQYCVYKALYGDGGIYCRPLDMFMSEVDHVKYPDVRQKYRFFVKFWGAKVSMHSWRGHALNTVRVLFRCVC